MTYSEEGAGPLVRLANAIGGLAIALSLSACATTEGKVDRIMKARDARPMVVATDAGPVEGRRSSHGIAFLGVPFGASTAGASRFSPPVPPQAWTAVRPALKLGSRCPQAAGRTSEDCLNLNVYAPHDAGPGSGLPVMVWLHGGALVSGSNAEFDGSRLAERQRVVVVVPNYRLGAFGFFAHPSLRGTGEGNWGMLDQRAALMWVKRNAEAFGGDPERVTLFGESAGATSACMQMAMPGSRGLFHRAILQSDTCIFPDQASSMVDAERGGAQMVRDLKCDRPDAGATIACLRSLSPSRLRKARSHRWGNGGPKSWSPAVGGDVLPRGPAAALGDGGSASIPVLMGSNHDEGRLWSNLLAVTLAWTSRAGFEKAVARAVMPEMRSAVLTEYGKAAEASYYRAFADIVTDSHFACPILSMHRLRGDAAADLVYEFDDPRAPTTLPTIPFTPRQKAYHSAELIYVFHQPLQLADPRRWKPGQRALADRMQDYWGRFAATGDPNGSGLPEWPRFDGREPLLLAPDRTGSADGFAGRHHCAFWNAHGY